MFSAKSLFSIAKKKILEVYKDHWTETNVLPKKLQKDLLEEWLHNDIVDDDPNIFLEHKSWNQLLPITPQVFVWLMCHPDEYPMFAYEYNHVIDDYYIKTNYESNCITRLCKDCFPRISGFYKPYSANVWLENNLIFKNIKSHNVVRGDDLLENVIWQEKKWCDECTCTPLFTIESYWDCAAEYDYHHCNKRCYHYDSDDSEDECKEIYSERVISGNRMSPTDYIKYKKMKCFE